MDTDAHGMAIAEAEGRYGEQLLELELPDAHTEHHTEVPHTHSTFHHGESSTFHCRHRPTLDDRVEELQESISNLSTQFDTFASDQRTKCEHRRSFEDDQRAEWVRQQEHQRQIYEFMTRFNHSYLPLP